MKAWICRRYVDPFEINYEEVPEKEPQDDEVQVDVRAVGLNFGEALVVAGKYQVKPPLPYIFGVEAAGIVSRCGKSVTRFKPGDKVVVMNSDISGGCCADKVTTSQQWVYPIPANLDFTLAASFASTYGTSYHALCRRIQLKAEDVLVVHGASGGVGLAAVQIGKMLGATVIATGGDDEKLAIVREQGADYVINANTDAVRERILEITRGRGADVHYDPVGGKMFEASMRAIAPGGCILVVGFTSGEHVKVATNHILVKMVSVIGVEYRAYMRDHPELARSDFAQVSELIGKGILRPYVSKTFKMPELQEAIQYLADRKVIGKCVILN